MTMQKNYYEFKPLNIGRWVVWSLFALLMAVAPLVFTSGLSITMLSQMGIAIIACLSYNMLLGQGGMLSFGHAVYSGMGSFLAMHTLILVSKGNLPLPVSLIPIAGGLASAVLAVVFRRRGRHLGKPSHRSQAVWHHLRPADPAVLPDCGLHLRVHRIDVRLHAHTPWPHAQRRAGQPRARGVRGL